MAEVAGCRVKEALRSENLDDWTSRVVRKGSRRYPAAERTGRPRVRGKDCVHLARSTIAIAFDELFSARVSGQRATAGAWVRPAKGAHRGPIVTPRAHYHGADRSVFALHHAQLVIARAYGFDGWPKLKAFVDGVTVRRLVDAVRAHDLNAVRRLLDTRPELARMSVSNLQVLHHAVLERAPEIVRLLMANGASAREGVYPHRDATTPHAIAEQRGYGEIVRIIEDEEQRARESLSGVRGAPVPDGLFRAIAAGDRGTIIQLLESNPALVHARHLRGNVTPLHAAAQSFDTRTVAALLDRGADPAARAHHDLTPLDVAAHRWYGLDVRRFRDTAALLLDRGAPMTAAAAAAHGDAAWLRARHREGTLTNQIEDSGGLLRIAATHDHPQILAMLLDFGFDPDERMRFNEGDDPVFSWGMPLQHGASTAPYRSGSAAILQSFSL